MEVEVQEVEVHDAVIPYIERYFETYPEDFRRLSVTHALLAEQLQRGMQQGMQQGRLQGIQQGQLQGVQQLLLRQLRRKFTHLPDAVRQRVEATTNLEQLETWLTQVIMANSLAETELGRILN
jgi:predicted transposase YdaD